MHPVGMQRPVENAAPRAKQHPIRDGILLTVDFNLRNVETLHATSLHEIVNQNKGINPLAEIVTQTGAAAAERPPFPRGDPSFRAKRETSTTIDN